MRTESSVRVHHGRVGMKPSRLTLCMVAAGAAAAIAGCGESSSPRAGPSSASATPSITVTSAPSVAAALDACKYVTTAQASELATSPVKAGVGRVLTAGPVTFKYCDYIFDPGNAPGVTVAVADLGSDGAALFAQFKQSKTSESNFQAVSGVGDEAFFSGENLSVRKGNKGLILYVGRSTGSPRGTAGLADEKRLAELVLGQL